MSDVMVEYSQTELTVMDILSKASPKGIDVHELTDLYYAGRERPFHAEAVIRNTLSALMRKNSLNSERFIITKTKRGGRTGAIFRLIRKK